jgi:hypothetical protein
MRVQFLAQFVQKFRLESAVLTFLRLDDLTVFVVVVVVWLLLFFVVVGGGGGAFFLLYWFCFLF